MNDKKVSDDKNNPTQLYSDSTPIWMHYIVLRTLIKQLSASARIWFVSSSDKPSFLANLQIWIVYISFWLLPVFFIAFLGTFAIPLFACFNHSSFQKISLKPAHMLMCPWAQCKQNRHRLKRKGLVIKIISTEDIIKKKKKKKSIKIIQTACQIAEKNAVTCRPS